jgi:hypothetical protein
MPELQAGTGECLDSAWVTTITERVATMQISTRSPRRLHDVPASIVHAGLVRRIRPKSLCDNGESPVTDRVSA